MFQTLVKVLSRINEKPAHASQYLWCLLCAQIAASLSLSSCVSFGFRKIIRHFKRPLATTKKDSSTAECSEVARSCWLTWQQRGKDRSRNCTLLAVKARSLAGCEEGVNLALRGGRLGERLKLKEEMERSESCNKRIVAVE